MVGHCVASFPKKQTKFEAKTLCAVVANLPWLKEIEGKKCFIYVDNEGLLMEHDNPLCYKNEVNELL